MCLWSNQYPPKMGISIQSISVGYRNYSSFFDSWSIHFFEMFHFFLKSWFCCLNSRWIPHIFSFPSDINPASTPMARRPRTRRGLGGRRRSGGAGGRDATEEGFKGGDGGGHVVPMIFGGLKCGKMIWQWLITVIYCDLHKLWFFHEFSDENLQCHDMQFIRLHNLTEIISVRQLDSCITFRTKFVHLHYNV